MKLAAAEGRGKEKIIRISKDEKNRILSSIALANSSANDKDEIVMKPFRLCAFIPVRLPIAVALVVGPPTLPATMAVHWLNQSWTAGYNYCNKNSSSTFTNEDMAKGYFAAVSSSMSVAYILRKITNSRSSKMATGRTLLLMNVLVNGTANATANFMNAYFMRKAEAKNGIDMFADKTLQKKVGVSRLAAE